MSVFRVEKNENYTIMSNYHLQERKMSLKAKGLLSLMLSLPKTWDYSIAGLVAICKENETSVKTALDELKEFGYLQVVKKMPNETKTGRIEYEYIVYEQKIHKVDTRMEIKVGNELIQELEKQGIENLGVEFQGVEKPIQLNTNKLNTNIDYKYIVDYLNSKAGTKYKDSTPKTRQFIKARINEKFTLPDFEKVIDNMCIEWKGTTMEKYLRPETLFGTKFESYLNRTPKKEPTKKPEARQYSKEQLDELFTNLDEVCL